MNKLLTIGTHVFFFDRVESICKEGIVTKNHGKTLECFNEYDVCFLRKKSNGFYCCCGQFYEYDLFSDMETCVKHTIKTFSGLLSVRSTDFHSMSASTAGDSLEEWAKLRISAM